VRVWGHRDSFWVTLIMSSGVFSQARWPRNISQSALKSIAIAVYCAGPFPPAPLAQGEPWTLVLAAPAPITERGMKSRQATWPGDAFTPQLVLHCPEAA
jgi:hypothetical protein